MDKSQIKELEERVFNKLKYTMVLWAIGGFVVIVGLVLKIVEAPSVSTVVQSLKEDEFFTQELKEAGIAPSANDVANAMKKVNPLMGVTTKIRNISYVTGINQPDEKDSGAIESRILRFNKAFSDTTIRVAYTDNFRVLNESTGCEWEIIIDGDSCESGELSYLFYNNQPNLNRHGASTVLGYCSGLDTGDHVVTVEVDTEESSKQAGRLADCHTGWKNSRWVLEALEVNSE